MGRLTGERRAIAAAVLAFYAFLFMLVAFAPPPGWGACFTALALVYGAGFFGLVAGYFWARWYSMGLGISGLISTIVSMWQIGPEPVLVFYGGTHMLASIALWGSSMAAGFDGKEQWRSRFHLDENATHRLGRAIIRVGVSLPYVVMYALAPKDGQSLALVGAAAALGGAWALFNLRSWGIVALGGAAALLASTLSLSAHLVPFSSDYAINTSAVGIAAVVMLVAAVAPFARPVSRYLLADKS